LQKDKRGSILTNDQLQVLAKSTADGEAGTALPDVYAMGDCAQIDGHPLPATAQVSKADFRGYSYQ